jgi:hypothetical protein
VLPPIPDPSRSESTLGSALLARFELCGPAVVDVEELPRLEDPKLEDPRLDDPPTAELPAPYGVPMVFERSCSMPPAVLDPSRSESTLGSALLARFELCGPEAVDEVLYEEPIAVEEPVLYEEPPRVEEPVFEILDPSRSESTLGSILFARLESCGPALVEPEVVLEVEVLEPV